jgi:AraC-binding-like domain
LAPIRCWPRLSSSSRSPGPGDLPCARPADRDPLHRHPELHSDDTASVAELLRSKDFELSLPPLPREQWLHTDQRDRPSSFHLCYVSYGAEAVVTTTPARNDYRVQLPMIGRSITVMGGTETICERTQAVVSSPVHDQTILLNDDCQRLLVYFASESLSRHLSAMLGEGIIGKVRFAPGHGSLEGCGTQPASLDRACP